MGNGGKATIADVARLAEVSIKTVSRVFNEEPNVRDGTRLKVLKAIETLDYRPDPSARSLAAGRSFRIGLLYVNPSASYLVDIQTGTLATSRPAGYDLIIHPCDYKSTKLEAQISELVTHGRMDGMILTPPLSDMAGLIRLLDKLQVPIVLIAPADRQEAFRSVYTNDREACAQMTQHLIDLGHSRIAFIGGHPDHKSVAQRVLGYEDALRDAGLPYRSSLVVQGFHSFESGREAAQRLLGRKHPPTAIFAATDDMAAGVLSVAHDLGISVPEQLSVAGFDDIPLARQLWPSLTTVNQPIQAMAEQAMRQLLAQLRSQSAAVKTGVIPARLVIRNSTGPCKG